ncbi:MAG: hypothetical protein IT235_07430 [Bacteroidia bacterium]|nr:hypothetical protein [Bacteroidia bacterium]
MGAKERQKIFEGIKQLAEVGMHEIYRGTVDSVDENEHTFDMKLTDTITVYNVRLKVITGDDEGVYVVPKKGSYVVACRMENSVDMCLLQCSKIDKWVLKIGNTTMKFDSNGIIANGGNNNGLVNVGILRTELQRLEAAITTVKNAAGVAMAVYSGALDGGASATAYNTAVNAIPAQNITTIEDTKFKH